MELITHTVNKVLAKICCRDIAPINYGINTDGSLLPFFAIRKADMQALGFVFTVIQT